MSSGSLVENTNGKAAFLYLSDNGCALKANEVVLKLTYQLSLVNYTLGQILYNWQYYSTTHEYFITYQKIGEEMYKQSVDIHNIFFLIFKL